MTVFTGILLKNAAACALLFSGVATAGISTVLGLGLSVYIGATFAAGASSVGTGSALPSIVLYAPLEFAAILTAAAAGLFPLFSTLVRGRSGLATETAFQRYSRFVGTALRLFVASMAMLLVAAVVETVLVTTR